MNHLLGLSPRSTQEPAILFNAIFCALLFSRDSGIFAPFIAEILSRLVKNVLPFDSLEMTSVDLIQAMLD
jgi:hypothetical protein